MELRWKSRWFPGLQVELALSGPNYHTMRFKVVPELQPYFGEGDCECVVCKLLKAAVGCLTY